MNFQTKISLKKQQLNQINYDSKLLLLGSCFSENIGEKLSYYKFQSAVNPFGILFHPKAIENLVLDAINEKVYTDDDLFFHNERWHCFNVHSKLSSTDKNKITNSLNNANNNTYKQLKNATHIIITLGTSWVYRFIETDSLVANCHKIPQKKFLKEILSINEITASIEIIISLIKSVNKNVNILFTVSPVRHLKDGFIENQRSKSHLLSAIHNIIEPRENTYYFPSYEIMMDELRDYRFYAEDMIHPNKTAINYIWDKFFTSWTSEETQQTMSKVAIIQKGLTHRSFNPTSEAHLKFLNNLQQKKETLVKAFPFMKF
ncbi:GSCFA domain-containing protein [Tenacibaculum sp. Bg11-29]|uniref:GSCFA domain-containing protein n=1 Tax=Tenacibaculum sp. Bg11-29 TaxID=2058306 RepID=UPI000C348F66|nr:GSCFA domain-containing protein [Tenacibaculum sp. Bg11-29]PKH49441.1 GSCFA domain-containing protein [Tenacibaculum sp. Bg11-29]